MCTDTESADPEVLQSGFGLHFLSWSGEFWENSPQISRQILQPNFSCKSFGLVSPEFQATQKNSPPKFTAKIVGFPPTPRVLKTIVFHADFCLRGSHSEKFPRFLTSAVSSPGDDQVEGSPKFELIFGKGVRRNTFQ